MKRKTLGLTVGLILALAIGFAGGSAWMGLRTYNTHERLVQNWVSELTFLIQNTHTARVMSPKDVTQSLGKSLDVISIRLAYVYDDLPQGSKEGIARYANAARNVAMAQQGEGFLNGRQHLLILAKCVQGAQKTGSSVRECATQNGMYAQSTADAESSSPPESKFADAR
jgi:hypothetical protein